MAVDGGGVGERRAAAAQVLVDDPAAPGVDAAVRHHLERVLRLRAGEAVVATDGRGVWLWCRFTGDAQVLEPHGPLAYEPPPAAPVTVAFSPVKGERPDWVVQKLTEIGVDRIVVLAADRAVVRWEGGRVAAAMERLGRVAAEACGQCRRVWLPSLAGPLPLGGATGLQASVPGTVLAEPGATPLGSHPLPMPAAVAIGPEGGWSEAERAGARGTVGLGPFVLRAETAAVVAATLLVAHRPGTVVGEG